MIIKIIFFIDFHNTLTSSIKIPILITFLYTHESSDCAIIN